MAFDPENSADILRLYQAVREHRRHLAVFRENRRELIRQFVGAHYSNDGSADKVPVGLMNLAMSVYMRQLAAQAPRVLVKAKRDTLKPFEFVLSESINQKLVETEFESVLQHATRNALLSLGLCRVGLATVDEDRTESFVEPISPQDWVHDTTAKSYADVSFAGFRYEMPVEIAKEAPEFDKKARDLISEDTRSALDADAMEEAGDESPASFMEPEQFEPTVAMWDIWLPRYGYIVTLPRNGSRALNVIDWEGPKHGPFHMLGFDDVPDEIWPLSPMATLMDLHTLANQLFVKLSRQGIDSKTVVEALRGAEDDARRITRGGDSEVVSVDEFGRIAEHKFGGMDAQNLALFLQSKNLFSWLGGNIDALGGLGPQSETLGQDQLLTAAASKRLSDMQERVTKFAKTVIHDLAWYEWTDELWERQINRPINNRGMRLSRMYGPEDRIGDFLEYNFDIIPYSMQDRSPSERVQLIMQVIQNVAMPLRQELAASHSFDFDRMFKMLADYLGLPEIGEILLSYGSGTGGGGSFAPSDTTRTNVRVSKPGATPRGAEDVMMRGMMGMKSQPSEMAAMGRAM
jgi:hypothetical protein